jgi:hypothetical protein
MAINDECNKIKFVEEAEQLELKVKEVKALNTEVKKKHEVINGKMKKLDEKIKLFLATDRKIIERRLVQAKFMDESLRSIGNFALSIGEYKCEILKLLNKPTMKLVRNCVLIGKNIDEELRRKGEQFSSLLYKDYMKLKEYDEIVTQLESKLKSN